MGVSPSKKYMFIIILSPSGAYYSSGLNPVNIYVENNYVRAVRGGMEIQKQVEIMLASLLHNIRHRNKIIHRFYKLDGVEKNILKKLEL